MRASIAVLCCAAPLLVASCTESQTALVAEFDIVGTSAGQARLLEVLLRCEPSTGDQVPMSFDLTLLGDGVTPTLAIEEGSPPCDMILAAQVYGEQVPGEPHFPLAATSTELAFKEGSVVTVTVTLDTDECADIDGDRALGGRGGVDSCGIPGALLDCDELDPGVHQGALLELCNGIDDDCDGVIDAPLTDRARELACSDQPVPWRPGIGLCKYWTPQCQNGAILCPDLDPDDDCDQRMDTNCDGALTGCGCDQQILDHYQGCEACFVPACRGEDIECVQPAGTPTVGTCCEGPEGPGRWRCDATTDEVVCDATDRSPEICNDTLGDDEDCDGAVNFDDEDCRPLDGLAIDCDPVTLPAVMSPADPLECDFTPTDVYNFALCTAAMNALHILVRGGSGMQLLYPWSENCCSCDIGTDDLAGLPVITVGSTDNWKRIGVEGAHLVIAVDVWSGDRALLQNVPMEIPIVPANSSDVRGEDIECLGTCYVIGQGWTDD